MTYQPSALQLQREAAKRRASRRSTLIALSSTLVFGFILAIVITGAQGYEMVKNSFFNWHYAKQAMPSGGEITIQATSNSNELILSIIDTGKGISKDSLEKIFKPFYSTRQGGTGLGLPTTRKIIEGHGGRMELQSELGKGTKFSIHLPLKHKEIKNG